MVAGLLASVLLAGPASAPPDVGAALPEPPRPAWSFRHKERPVKVVVLAGSIGAWPGNSYTMRLTQTCANIEVRNLSKTGLGAWALKRRFKTEVLDNRRLGRDADEYWLVFGGGLNSVGSPQTTNHHIHQLFKLAHAAGWRIVGLTLTPWGSERDRRFAGLGALKYRRATALVSQFILGHETPSRALGSFAARRASGAEAPWATSELADVSIDLYDSELRDKTAAARDVEAMRELLRHDRAWQRDHADDAAPAHAAALEADAWLAADAPRWYLRPDLRSFDHTHPTAAGHEIIAQTMCPQLPESWGCECSD